MEIELYRNTKAEIPDGEKEKDSSIKKAQELCKRYRNLGLEGQATMIEKAIKVGGPLITDKIKPDLFWRKISDNDLRIWRIFLPTSYRSDLGPGRTLASYAFDQIPEEVISEFELAKALRLFNVYEVRTPEGRNIDPILIGLYGNTSYLIARWGESLQSFEEIKRQVRQSRGW
ncbi:MAG: hypothetical protein HZB99_03440 [Candidatus Harrisonbacteria bacterium]|nr:hypothetical protein [Candidatus Harrisonbacteria bacterium]